jgi:hypothetical protein
VATEKQAAAPAFDMKAHRKRADKAWQDRSYWDKLYCDAYEFAIPYRRPSQRVGKGKQRVERCSTRPRSKARSAPPASSIRIYFPPGFWKLAPAPSRKRDTGEQGRP